MATAHQTSSLAEQGVSYNVALAACVLTLQAGLTPYLVGPPGCGKTAMAPEIVRLMKLGGMRITKPSFHDVVDYTGVPFIADGGTWFAPNYSIFPGPNDPDTGLLFIDEAADAPVSVQNIVCAIAEERRVASYPLPAGWHTMLAGNRVEDKSGAVKEITKLTSRIVKIVLNYTQRDFAGWALTHDILDWITGYTAFKPEHLNTFDPTRLAEPYACPRTWAKANAILKINDNLDSPAVLAALDGVLGPAVSRSFRGYVTLLADMPDPVAVIANPKTAPIPNRPEVRWALSSSLISHTTKGNVGAVRTYVERLPEQELAMFVLRSLLDTKASKILCPEYAAWVTDRKDLL